MENDTELNCLKAASKKENSRVPTAAIGESNRLHNIFSASQEEQQPERHLCCISNISVTGGDLQGGQGCRHCIGMTGESARGTMCSPTNILPDKSLVTSYKTTCRY